MGIHSQVATVATNPSSNWRWMTAWLIVGLLIYFGYGYRNSVLRSSPAHPRADSRP